jgi:L-amino acid N-acyltransferase YncA
MDTYDKQLEAISGFWASSLGCDSEALAKPGLTICRRIAPSDREKILVFKRDEACVIEVQEKTDASLIYATVADALRERRRDSSLDVDLWTRLFNLPAGSVVGPAYVGYLDGGKLVPYRAVSARLLTDKDQGALRRLRERCPAIEWEHSGIELDGPPIFGCINEGEVVSAASFHIWGSEIAHIGVISDPSNRGRRAGKAAVSAASAEAISEGLIPQYRTLKSNTPSLRIAQALGFVEYATTLSIAVGGVERL